MADDVTVDNGGLTDYAVATDDVAGKHYQRVKLDVGGDGASVPVEGEMPVGGDVAHDAADSGNPVKIGGKASSLNGTPVALNDRVDAAFDTFGAQVVASGVVITSADARSNSYSTGMLGVDDGDGAPLQVYPFNYNGVSWDRQRGDIDNGLDVDVTRLPALPAGTNNIGDVDVVSTALPTGAATSAKQDTLIGHVDGLEGLLTTIDGDTGALAGTVSGNELQVDVLTVPSPLSTAGNGTAAAAHRVTIASDSTGVIAVTDNGGSLTVDGTVAVSNFPATQPVSGTFWQATQPVSGTFFQATQPVSLAATVVTKQRADTATLSNVASSATSVTVLATNTSRLGCSIQNDSTEVLYLKFGTTASSTSYTVKMAADAHYEVPFGYTDLEVPEDASLQPTRRRVTPRPCHPRHPRARHRRRADHSRGSG
jgi:hypothetical protein